MNEYDFVLRFSLPEPSQDPQQFLSSLEQQGCSDATVGLGKLGFIALDFTRSAPSFEKATSKATSDVLRAIPSATLVDIEKIS